MLPFTISAHTPSNPYTTLNSAAPETFQYNSLTLHAGGSRAVVGHTTTTASADEINHGYYFPSERHDNNYSVHLHKTSRGCCFSAERLSFGDEAEDI